MSKVTADDNGGVMFERTLPFEIWTKEVSI